MKISRYSDRQSGVLFPIKNALPDTGTTPPLLRFSVVARAGGLPPCRPTLEGVGFYRPIRTEFLVTTSGQQRHSSSDCDVHR
ncbi:hypothetical protein [Laspinema olomoucense]|uniref:hypothetical protein n=1 Tax=Laspinema olomoucense TaxID=3231600 RepID=UPI0021BA6577|nr:hypothetical protein [Laspinema sp. D3c]MCT7993109.1 hypothetical protein [Laspinema sp. D3c]